MRNEFQGWSLVIHTCHGTSGRDPRARCEVSMGKSALLLGERLRCGGRRRGGESSWIGITQVENRRERDLREDILKESEDIRIVQS